MRPNRPRDAHALLGVDVGASRAEIRRAYRRRALEIHPDVTGGDSTAEMAALNEARDQLLSRMPGRRATAAAESGDPASEPRQRTARPKDEPSFSHAPTWDDYWAAWNDPPRRPR